VGVGGTGLPYKEGTKAYTKEKKQKKTKTRKKNNCEVKRLNEVQGYRKEGSYKLSEKSGLKRIIKKRGKKDASCSSRNGD